MYVHVRVLLNFMSSRFPPRANFFSQFTLFYRVECEKLFCKTNIELKVLKLNKTKRTLIICCTRMQTHSMYELREYAEVLRKAPGNLMETDEGFRYVAQQAKSMVEELDAQAVSLSLLAALRLLDALVFRDAALDPESASNTPLFAMLRPAGVAAALAQFYSRCPAPPHSMPPPAPASSVRPTRRRSPNCRSASRTSTASTASPSSSLASLYVLRVLCWPMLLQLDDVNFFYHLNNSMLCSDDQLIHSTLSRINWVEQSSLIGLFRAETV